MKLSPVLLSFMLAASLVAGLEGQSRAGGRTTAAQTASRTLRLYIARHGETAYNAERRIQGQLDVPLNSRGREQAAALRDTLRGVVFDAIYTSPLARNVETAAIIADGRPVRVLTSLTERSQGRFQGLLADSAEGFTRRMTDPRDDLDGGETTFQLADRARSAIASIRRGHPGGSVLIVGHFLTNQMLLRELLSLRIEEAMQVTQGNDELYLIELSPRSPARSWKLIDLQKLGEL